MIVPDLFQAIRDMISDEAVRVGDDSAPLSSPPTLSDFPYLVVAVQLPTDFSGGGFDEPTLADQPDSFEASVRLTYAAASRQSMQWLVNRVRPALNRRVPVVDGYVAAPLRLESGFDTDHDRTITLEGGLNPLYAVDRTRIIATRSRRST